MTDESDLGESLPGDPDHEEGAAGEPAATPVAAEPQRRVPDASSASSSGALRYSNWHDDPMYRAAWSAVPKIGQKWTRWYDVPYLFLGWWLRSWRAKVVPRPVRSRMHRWRRDLISCNDHDRNKAWSRSDPLYNMFVPADERVTVPALWVVELFPPSAALELDALMRRHNPTTSLLSAEVDAVELFRDVRAGHAYDWFSLGVIQGGEPAYFVADRAVDRLPDEFETIELIAIQLGTGLTAIVACCHLTEKGATSLDREWHRQHEPRLRRHGRGLRAENRLWSAFGETQQKRREPHDAAREWMSRNYRGLFAQAGEPQPLIDLLVVEKHDPANREDLTSAHLVALRGLGLSGTDPATISPILPEFALARTSLRIAPDIGTDRTMALWGNRTAAAASRPHLSRYPRINGEYRALARELDGEMRNVFLALSMTEMIRLMQRRYAKLRDSARQQHDSFSPEYVEDLRQTLLTFSIDLTSVSADVETWWERHRSDTPPVYVHRGDSYFRDEDDSYGLTEYLRAKQAADLARLREGDGALRDILSTVASLGAANDAYKLGRIALYVAAISLGIAVVTLLLTSIGNDSVAVSLGEWIRHVFSEVSSWLQGRSSG